MMAPVGAGRQDARVKISPNEFVITSSDGSSFSWSSRDHSIWRPLKWRLRVPQIATLIVLTKSFPSTTAVLNNSKMAVPEPHR